MGLSLVTAPAAPVFDLDEAREHLNLDRIDNIQAGPDDALIEEFVRAATAEIDGRDGWLGRALVTQTWRLYLDEFPTGRITLPLPPLQSVASIKYLDRAGTQATLDPAAYRVGPFKDPGYVEPVFGGQWPQTLPVSDAVEITFVAGYGQPADVPAVIKQYLRHRVGQFYEHREAIIAGTIVSEVPHVRHSLESIRYRGGLT